MDRKRKLPKNMNQLKQRKCDISCIEMGNWLTDLHISSACELLRGKLPTLAGFQDPIKSHNCSFQRIDDLYVQIIHTDGNHRITLSGIHESVVKVYDSIKTSISNDTKEQIASLMVADKNILMSLLKICNTNKTPQIVDYMQLHLSQEYVLETTPPDTGLYNSVID